jgi:hypothetical protein
VSGHEQAMEKLSGSRVLSVESTVDQDGITDVLLYLEGGGAVEIAVRVDDKTLSLLYFEGARADDDDDA